LLDKKTLLYYGSYMTAFFATLWVLLAALLVAVLAMRPERTHQSHFELKRLSKEPVLRRERLLGGVYALRQVVVGIVLLCLLLSGLAAWKSTGVLVTFILWLVVGFVAQLGFVHRQAMRLYTYYEPSLLGIVERASLLVKLFGAAEHAPRDRTLESREQLAHLIEASGHVLSSEQQIILTNGLAWHETPVAQIMTPVARIVSIKNRELLGPLVLDDLHRSGHSRFPVIRGSLNSIVGILEITDLLDITTAKGSETAEKIMSVQVLRIESDKPLPHALELLQKSHQHMLIVVDEAGDTVGLLTLTDMSQSLLGKTGVE
jgi:CBS domain containing-hemolysin-like protein